MVQYSGYSFRGIPKGHWQYHGISAFPRCGAGEVSPFISTARRVVRCRRLFRIYIAPTSGLTTWLELAGTTPDRNILAITVHGSVGRLTRGVPLVTVGSDVISMVQTGGDRIRFSLAAGSASTVGAPVTVKANKRYQVIIDADLSTGHLSVTSQQGQDLLHGQLNSSGAIVIHKGTALFRSEKSKVTVSVVDVNQRASERSLCRTLLSGS